MSSRCPRRGRLRACLSPLAAFARQLRPDFASTPKPTSAWREFGYLICSTEVPHSRPSLLLPSLAAGVPASLSSCLPARAPTPNAAGRAQLLLAHPEEAPCPHPLRVGQLYVYRCKVFPACGEAARRTPTMPLLCRAGKRETEPRVRAGAGLGPASGQWVPFALIGPARNRTPNVLKGNAGNESRGKALRRCSGCFVREECFTFAGL